MTYLVLEWFYDFGKRKLNIGHVRLKGTTISMYDDLRSIWKHWYFNKIGLIFFFKINSNVILTKKKKSFVTELHAQ